VKFVDEYRDAHAVTALRERLRRTVTRPWTVMEVCGGQTHNFLRFGVDRMLPEGFTLVHGPGCPVCVTSAETLDRAIAIASRPEVTFCSFGDMLRVPGSRSDLMQVKAAGGDVRMVYSPLDALRIARENPDRQVVFFAVGFETTAPANGMAALRAESLGLENFSLLVAHVLVLPAMEAILALPGTRVQGFLAAGHVCTVVGYEDYEPLARRYRTPIVVTGFEPVDLLEGAAMLATLLERGEARVENQYSRSVRREGNPAARAVMDQVFEVVDRQWRGIGPIPSSGLRLRARFARMDAERRFDVSTITATEPPECRAGEVLQGLIRPVDCPAFAGRCTPEQPLGAPMVSTEGACAAYYRYRRRAEVTVS
jgi:hydrogenase expression/formation protein HypD